MVAYIATESRAEGAEELVVLSELTGGVEHRISFGSIAAGATALVWSPNEEYIALYAGVFSTQPRLVLVDVLSHLATEVPLQDTVAVDGDEDLVWACPEWNPTSDKLVLMVRHNGGYRLVTTDFEGNTTVLVDGLTRLSHPDWRM